MLTKSRVLRRTVRFILKRIISISWLRAHISQWTRKGVISASIWKWLPVDLTFSVCLPDGSTFYYAGSEGDHIARRLFWGGLERFDPIWTVLFGIARRADLILDLGANTGAYTLIACAANSKCKVIAFEPVPNVFQRLRHNLEINKLDDRVVARQEAVSNFVGSAQLAIPHEDCPVMSSLDLDDYIRMYQLKDMEFIDVPVTTIDEVCSQSVGVHLVKVDVQGSEHLVIRGMREVLIHSRPAIIVDYHQSCPPGAIENALTEFGYLFFKIQEKGLSGVRRIEEVGSYLALTMNDLDRLKDCLPPIFCSRLP